MSVPPSPLAPGAAPDDAPHLAAGGTVVEWLRSSAAEQVEPIERLRRLVVGGHLLDVPRPAQGATARRFEVLAEVAAADLSLARLVEGHLDALAILAEADRPAHPGAYGVWAAERPGGAVTAILRRGTCPSRSSPAAPATTAAPVAPDGSDHWELVGVKPYASGAGRLDRALVTATTVDGPRLFDVDLSAGDAVPVPGTWPAVGMADSLSASVRFDALGVPGGDVVGPPGFYTQRPGFWVGSVGVAACWYGGALGIRRALGDALRRRAPGPAPERPEQTSARPASHQLAHFGAIVARVDAMAATLAAAAAAIDADPLDQAERRRWRALSVRHLVYEGCLEVLDHAARAGRTSLLTGDAALARRVADLPVYLSQHHPDDDLAALGRAALEADADAPPVEAGEAPAVGAGDALPGGER